MAKPRRKLATLQVLLKEKQSGFTPSNSRQKCYQCKGGGVIFCHNDDYGPDGWAYDEAPCGVCKETDWLIPAELPYIDQVRYYPSSISKAV